VLDGPEPKTLEPGYPTDNLNQTPEFDPAEPEPVPHAPTPPFSQDDDVEEGLGLADDLLHQRVSGRQAREAAEVPIRGPKFTNTIDTHTGPRCGRHRPWLQRLST